MNTVTVKDANNAIHHFLVGGSGTALDPYIGMMDTENPKDFHDELSQGNLVDKESFSKFGQLPLIPNSGGSGDVWSGSGLYTGFPDAGQENTLEVVSTSNNDTGGGTGARTVLVSNLLDASYNELPPVMITLDGTTPVSLGAQLYFRASTLTVMSAGSLETNDGMVSLRYTAAPASVFALVPVNYGKSTTACYTVPADKSLCLNSGLIGMTRSNGSNASASVTFRVRPFGGIFLAEKAANISTSQGYIFQGNNYVIVPSKSDVKVRVENTSDNNCSFFTEFSGFLEIPK